MNSTTPLFKIVGNCVDSNNPFIRLTHDQSAADEAWISVFYTNDSTKQGDLGWNAAGDAYFRNFETGGDLFLITPNSVEVQADSLILDDPSGVFEVQSTADAKIILRDDSTSAWNRIDFYETTNRHGYLGFNTANGFVIVNEESAGVLKLETTGGGEIQLDDGGTNDGRVASIKAITTSTSTPTGDYPWGCLHLIY